MTNQSQCFTNVGHLAILARHFLQSQSNASHSYCSPITSNCFTRNICSMKSQRVSLESLIRGSTHALVIGVGGGGDVVGALATARFLEFCGLRFTLGGLPWERFV